MAACNLCGLKNVIVEQIAVSEYSGETILNIPGENSSPEASIESVVTRHEMCCQEKVRMVSLDDYFASEKQRISAIKMDVEGHELSVFKGASRCCKVIDPHLFLKAKTAISGKAVP